MAVCLASELSDGGLQFLYFGLWLLNFLRTLGHGKALVAATVGAATFVSQQLCRQVQQALLG